jgi:hypothetical protein
VNRGEFEEVRRWGKSLRRSEADELHAAGEAIVLLCREVDRLEAELARAQTPLVAPDLVPEEELGVEDTQEDVVEATLRGRLRTRIATLHR